MPNYENKSIERKYWKFIQKNQFLMVTNSFLELEKDFIELKDIELKDREVKIKKEIKNYFSICRWYGWFWKKGNEENKTN